jgi:hypothetical protein
MSQFQWRFVIASIVYICLYVPIFFLVWLGSLSQPWAESDRLLYFIAPFHILAVIASIAVPLLVIRHILNSSFSARWSRVAWLAFIVFVPQLGPIVWLMHTAHELPLSPTIDNR